MMPPAAGRPAERIAWAAAVLLTVFVLTSCSKAYVPVLCSSAPDTAVIDLSRWSFEKDGIVRLFGNTWEMYWRRFIAPGDFDSEKKTQAPLLVKGGSPWNDIRIDGPPLPTDGYATYRMRIIVPAARIYSFYIKNQDSAYRLWINGTLLAENGIPARTKEAYKAQRLPRSFHYYADKKEMDVVLHIANFTHKWGGLTNNIYLGFPEQMQPFTSQRSASVFFLAGTIIIMAVYHLFLYLSRRTEKAALYFFLFCFFVFFSYLFTGDYLFFKLFPDFPLPLGIRFNYFSLFGQLPFFLLFIGAVYPGIIQKSFIRLLVISGFAFMLSVVVLPVKVFGAYTLLPYYCIVALSTVLVLFILIRAVRQTYPGAVIALVGITVFLAAAFYDIAANRKLIVGSPFSPFLPAGMLVFILCQALILAMRFSASFKKIDTFAHTLEIKVEQRTAELQEIQKKLNEQQKLAALGTLAGGISHEILNPLSGISGPLSIIRKEIDSGDRADRNKIIKHLEYIKSNVETITGTIKNINILVAEETIPARPVNLYPIVSRLIDEYSKKTEKKIDFRIAIDDNAEVSAEPGMLSEIIGNLLSNAVDAIEEQGRITVTLEGSLTEWRLSIEDTGRGMSQEEQDRIFNPFFTTKHTSGGSGIGLFIVRKFTGSLGWEIEVESQPRRGTRISLFPK